MPFGTFYSNKKQNKPAISKPPVRQVRPVTNTPIPSQPPLVMRKDNVAVQHINILVVARLNSEIADFMVALSNNANESLIQSGLSLYCEDQQMVNYLIARKNQTEYNVSVAENILDTLMEDKSQLPIRYPFKLCIPGNQYDSFAIDFLSAGNGQNPPAPYDAMWILLDSPVYEAYSASDSYISYVQSALQSAKSRNMPVMLIMSQFEKHGKVKYSDLICSVESEVYSELSRRIKELLGDAAEKVPIVPVQCYGSGIYRSAGCQMPLIFTLENYYKKTTLEEHPIINSIKKLSFAQKSDFTRHGIKIGV